MTMKPPLLIISAIACCELLSCSRQPTRPALVNPHPASEAFQVAIATYPELGKKGSTFNRIFVDLVEQRKVKNPQSLTYANWPLEVAEDTARVLGFPTAPKTQGSQALDRRAYGASRAVPHHVTVFDQTNVR